MIGLLAQDTYDELVNLLQHGFKVSTDECQSFRTLTPFHHRVQQRDETPWRIASRNQGW
jgi:hypothetical protein